MAAYSAKAGPSLVGHTAKPLAFYGAIETLAETAAAAETDPGSGPHSQ